MWYTFSMKAKFQYLQKIIFKWFGKNGRHALPWRRKKITPYEVWVSEIMLQQTQVSRVLIYYEKFLERFPNIEILAKTSWEHFLLYYRGLGYYRRGENMLKTAKILTKKYGGKFPRDVTALEALPGIGEYTARAILSFGYKKPYLAFDTNVKRVLGRFLHGSKYAILNKALLECSLKGSTKILNAGLMDFANAVCAKQPKCECCPLKKRCIYFQTKGKLESRKTRKNAKKTKFLLKDARVLLCLHKDHKEYYSSNSDHYEFFSLPVGVNTREKIKTYFQEKYHLELAVRPPHKKVVLSGIPTLFINAQILLGKHAFRIFTKKEIKKYA